MPRGRVFRWSCVGMQVNTDDYEEVALAAADAIDNLAGTMDKAAEVQSTEQEAYRLWVDVIDAEMQALEELKVEFPSISDDLDDALGAAQTARDLAIVSADLSKSYWEANDAEADRLRDLAETLRELAED